MNAKPNSPRGGHRPALQQRSPPNPTPAPALPVTAPTPAKSVEKDCKATPGGKHRLDYATALFALIAAIGGIGAAAFSGYQGWVAHDTEERQLRPYVSVEPGDWTGNLNAAEGGTVTARPKIVISGQTPAGGLAPEWELIVFDFPVANFIGIPNYIVANARSNISGVPGRQPIPIDLKSLTVTKEDFAKINAGNKKMYAIGIVVYYDSFGKLRWTDFCFGADFKQLTANTMEACPIHNSADWNRISPQNPASVFPIPMYE
jgi:hypothetical protein